MYFDREFIKQLDIAVGTYLQGLSTKGTYVFHLYANKLSEYTVNAVEHLILAAVSYVVLCVALYVMVNRDSCSDSEDGSDTNVTLQRRPRVRKFEKAIGSARRVLLVTAHPDDECMFFGPTVYRLTHQTDSQLYLLCLSTGNKYGQGEQRKAELFASCDVLGIRQENIVIYNCSVLPDDPKTRWREDVIAQIVLRHVESYEIDTLITFDKHGVSRHSNHCSIYYAIAYLSIEKRMPDYCKVYTLDSINLLRKYWLMLDLPISYLLSANRYVLRRDECKTLLEAMREHTSQYVWFRRLYVRFSRYMMINTLQQLDRIDLELDLTLDD